VTGELVSKEVEADLRSARLLLAGQEYSQTIVHCQHAAEKTLKGALALRSIIITRQHAVSPDFVAAYADFAEANQIGLAVSALETGRRGFATNHRMDSATSRKVSSRCLRRLNLACHGPAYTLDPWSCGEGLGPCN